MLIFLLSKRINRTYVNVFLLLLRHCTLYNRPMLTLRALTVARGPAILARDLACTVPAGGVLLLTGPNGSGKTSLLRILAGLLPPASGTVEVPPEPPHWVAAQPLPPSRETAREYLAFQAALMGGSHTPANDPFAIAQVLDTPLGRLSTGWRQRVKLTRLTLAERPLWLLDEPSDGLDADGLARLQKQITAHASNGGAVIIATHQPQLWPEAAKLDFGGLA